MNRKNMSLVISVRSVVRICGQKKRKRRNRMAGVIGFCLGVFVGAVFGLIIFAVVSMNDEDK